MKFKSVLSFAIVGMLAFASCTTPKNVDYFQDTLQGQAIQLSDRSEHNIHFRPKDKIFILVSSKDPVLASLFTLSTPSRMSQTSRGNAATGINLNSGSYETTMPYTINSEGKIDFPVLGEINVAGLTRQELAANIQSQLINSGLIQDAIVVVEYQNLIVSVLGEVRNPGNYYIDRDNYSILDAISSAGDLTINGVRDNVRVLRRVGDEECTYTVNLLSAQETFNSPAYYLQQNDIVYVEPNDLVKRNTVNNANNVRNSSFWFSTGSMLISLAVLLFK